MCIYLHRALPTARTATTGDEKCATVVLTGEPISSSRRRHANRQANQNSTTGVLTGESIHQQRKRDRNSLCRGRALCPRFLRRKKFGIGPPCSGRCPETPFKLPCRAALDSSKSSVMKTVLSMARPCNKMARVLLSWPVACGSQHLRSPRFWVQSRSASTLVQPMPQKLFKGIGPGAHFPVRPQMPNKMPVTRRAGRGLSQNL